jgi:excisionase family DNA binding protein
MERLSSVKDFSTLAGISPSTVYRLVWKGEIPIVRLGGQIRIPGWFVHRYTKQPGDLPVCLSNTEEK